MNNFLVLSFPLLMLSSCQTSNLRQRNDESKSPDLVIHCVSDHLIEFKSLKYNLFVEGELKEKGKIASEGWHYLFLEDSLHYELEIEKKGYTGTHYSFCKHTAPDTIEVDIYPIISVHRYLKLPTFASQIDYVFQKSL